MFSLPIVTSNEGAISDIVSHKKNGFVIDINNLNKFKDSIIDLIEDEKKRYKFSEMSSRIFKKRFEEDVFISNLDKIFQKIIK